MGTIATYLWIIFLIIYIISPIDAHPLFLDDLVAGVVLFLLLYNNARKKKQRYYGQSSQSRSSGQSRQGDGTGREGPISLDEAYRILEVSHDAAMDEVSRAYKERMSKSHPDKVSHLSQELQERAKELTLRINEAYDLIKRHRS